MQVRTNNRIIYSRFFFSFGHVFSLIGMTLRKYSEINTRTKKKNINKTIAFVEYNIGKKSCAKLIVERVFFFQQKKKKIEQNINHILAPDVSRVPLSPLSNSCILKTKCIDKHRTNTKTSKVRRKIAKRNFYCNFFFLFFLFVDCTTMFQSVSKFPTENWLPLVNDYGGFEGDTHTHTIRFVNTTQKSFDTRNYREKKAEEKWNLAHQLTNVLD